MSSSPWPPATRPVSSWAARALTGNAAPSCPRQVEGDAEVLAVERDLEPERVVVVEHPAAPVGQDPALRRSPAEGADDLLDVEAGLDRQDDALGDAQVGAGQDDLVDGLDRLAGADRTDVGDRPAHGGQDGPGLLDVGRVAAHEDRQRRVAGALAPARDGGVDHAQLALRQSRGEVPAARRGDGRAVDDQRPGSGAVDDAVRAEQHGLDVRRVRDADDDDVDESATAWAAVGGHDDAEIGELVGATGRPVPAGDGETGAREVGRHRGAHRAEAEERDAPSFG